MPQLRFHKLALWGESLGCQGNPSVHRMVDFLVVHTPPQELGACRFQLHYQIDRRPRLSRRPAILPSKPHAMRCAMKPLNWTGGVGSPTGYLQGTLM